MGLDSVSCYIYNNIKGTPEGHMIVRNTNNTWYDNDDMTNSNGGTVTVIRSQQEYDQLEVQTKTGIVCVPDTIDVTGIGIPYVEMEPSDESFYGDGATVYKAGNGTMTPIIFASFGFVGAVIRIVILVARWVHHVAR